MGQSGILSRSVLHSESHIHSHFQLINYESLMFLEVYPRNLLRVLERGSSWILRENVYLMANLSEMILK